MSQDIKTTGSCHCGKVKISIEGKVLTTGVCHCHDCQKLTGGTAWPFLVVPRACVKIEGEIQEYGRTGASGKNIDTGFCRHCGSTLYGKPDAWPSIYTISASCLKNNTWFSPQMHVWTSEAPKWHSFDDALPKFDKNPK